MRWRLCPFQSVVLAGAVFRVLFSWMLPNAAPAPPPPFEKHQRRVFRSNQTRRGPVHHFHPAVSFSVATFLLFSFSHCRFSMLFVLMVVFSRGASGPRQIFFEKPPNQIDSSGAPFFFNRCDARVSLLAPWNAVVFGPFLKRKTKRARFHKYTSGRSHPGHGFREGRGGALQGEVGPQAANLRRGEFRGPPADAKKKTKMRAALLSSLSFPASRAPAACFFSIFFRGN